MLINNRQSVYRGSRNRTQRGGQEEEDWKKESKGGGSGKSWEPGGTCNLLCAADDDLLSALPLSLCLCELCAIAICQEVNRLISLRKIYPAITVELHILCNLLRFRLVNSELSSELHVIVFLGRDYLWKSLEIVDREGSSYKTYVVYI